MAKARRLLGVVGILALVVVGMAAAQPAGAAHVACGTVITQSTTLDSDVGPCPGDGLVVQASNVTINLGTRRVFAANGQGDNAGIRLLGVSGVTVTNGTVEGFDAGIAIMGGSGNVVERTIVQNNINDFQSAPCNLGDGIALFNSDNNRIEGNVVRHNGPYGGISAVEDSDANLIRRNWVVDNNVVAAPEVGCGNVRQDEGIRIEGPGASNNRVESNSVERSLLSGVGIHAYVCDPEGPPEPPNSHTMVLNNSIRGTAGTSVAAGINILELGPIGAVTCAATDNTIVGNISNQNQPEGIFVSSTSVRNTISRNTVNQNGGDGILLNGPVFENQFTNVGPTLFDVVQPDRAPYVQNTNFRVMSGSGSGDVTARLVPIDITLAPNATSTNNPVPVDTSTSGCEMSDFTAAGFQPGDVALIQRGTCTFVQKVQNAIAAGASAVVMFNEGQAPGRVGANFGAVGPVNIPVLSASYSVGFELYNLARTGTVAVHIVTNTTNIEVQVGRGAEDNVLHDNRGTGNGEHDGHDNNPDCDNNDWTRNLFNTVNQPCVAADGGTGSVPVAAFAAQSAAGTEQLSGVGRRPSALTGR